MYERASVKFNILENNAMDKIDIFISIFRLIPFLSSWTHLEYFQNTRLYGMYRRCSLFQFPGDCPSSSRSFVSDLQFSITATNCPHVYFVSLPIR